MNILHIHPSLAGGGIESMICALANEMAKSENITVCSIFEPKGTDTFWYKLSPSVRKITLKKKNIGFSFKVLLDIYRIIRRGNFDVVNVHGMFYYYVLSILLLHKKIRFFYTIHSDARMENSKWDKRLFFLKKISFNKGWMHPITISKVSQESFHNLYHCSSFLIFNGVTRPVLTQIDLASRFRINGSHTKIFLHAARISTPKNQLVLCKVFKKLIDEGYDIVLLIAGAKQRDDIFSSIEPFFGDRIKYLGERNDIPQLMAYCDGMCLPSLWEGLPITLLEALSVGCIPICSNVGGIPDVIKSGKNGFLSISSSEHDYYLAMKEFLSLSSEQYLAMKRNCIESFSSYDIINTAESYISTYKSV